jgi:hypothetical protein
VRDLDDEIAATEEQQARAPFGIAAVEPEIEPQPTGIEGDGAFGVGRADDDVIEGIDRCGFVGTCKRRGRGGLPALAELERHAVRRVACQDESIASALARHGAPLKQTRCLVEIACRERHR